MKKEFKVLFIDDNDISDEVESINKSLRKTGKKIIPVIIDLKLDIFYKEKIEGGDSHLNLGLIMKYLHESGYMETDFDIVACDFNFSDDYVNGYELLTKIINVAKDNKKCIRKSKFIFYTGKRDQLIKIANQDIKKLLSLRLDTIVDRPELTQTIVKLTNIIGNELNFEKMFVDLLSRHDDKIFNNVYPNFHGKEIKHVRNEIEKETDNGKQFVRSLVELSISHLIELQES